MQILNSGKFEPVRGNVLHAKYLLFLFPLALHLSKGYINRWLAWSEPLFWIADIFVYIAVPAAALWSLKRLYGIFPRDYGLLRPFQRYFYTWKDLSVDIVYAAVCLFVVSAAASYLAYLVWPEPPTGNIYSGKIADFGLPLHILMKLYLSLTASVVEEVLYRGFLYKLISDWIPGKKFANTVFVFVSSGLFVTAHSGYSIPEMAPVFAFGLCASILYLGNKRLEPLIIGHFLVDMVYL